MKAVLILEGKRLWKRYDKYIDVRNCRHGLRVKVIEKKNKSYEYYYYLVPQNGADALLRGETADYEERYFGSVRNALPPLIHQNELQQFRSQVVFHENHFACKEEVFHEIQRIASSLFQEAECIPISDLTRRLIGMEMIE